MSIEEILEEFSEKQGWDMGAQKDLLVLYLQDHNTAFNNEESL